MSNTCSLGCSEGQHIHLGEPCGCRVVTYDPHPARLSLEYCRLHRYALVLRDTLLWLYNVVISNIGKDGEEPSLEEREAAVKAAQTVLQEVA